MLASLLFHQKKTTKIWPGPLFVPLSTFCPLVPAQIEVLNQDRISQFKYKSETGIIDISVVMELHVSRL